MTEGLQCRALDIPEAMIFRSRPRSDCRGSVTLTYSQSYLAGLGIDARIVHENHCHSPRPRDGARLSLPAYQRPPYGQWKLVRIIRARMLDVNVDLRRSSPSFGQHVKAELDPRAGTRSSCPWASRTVTAPWKTTPR